MRHAWNRLQRVLWTGLFIVAPISLSFILLAWFITVIDGLLAPVIGFIGMPIPGLGLLIAFVLVLLAGILGSNLVGRHLLEATEEFLLRIPVFNWVYRTVKQLSEAFSPSSRAGFKGVVLIEYPRPGVYSLGFVTKHMTIEEAGIRRAMACVYVPTNHMYIGDVIVVPEENVLVTPLSQQDGIQAMMSAGAALPDLLKAVKTARKPEA